MHDSKVVNYESYAMNESAKEILNQINNWNRERDNIDDMIEEAYVRLDRELGL